MAFEPYVATGLHIFDCQFDFHIVNETARLWYGGSTNQYMPERDWCWKHIHPGMTIVDCGAHHGMMSLIFAKATGAQGKVIAYEALPSNAEVIAKNATLNGVTNITVRPVGVGSAKEIVRIAFNESNTVVVGFDAPGHAGYQAVQLVRLDDDLPDDLKIDFLKIDVEGHDLAALQGMRRTLGQRPTIDLELHNFIFANPRETLAAIVELLQPLGYSWALMGEIHENPVPIIGELSVEQLAAFQNPHLFGVPVTPM